MADSKMSTEHLNLEIATAKTVERDESQIHPFKQADELPALLDDKVEKQEDELTQYLKGLRLHFTTAAFVCSPKTRSFTESYTSLCLCLFLTNLEIPIVTTALVGITNDLGGFNKSSWIISAYLLGYVGP